MLKHDVPLQMNVVAMERAAVEEQLAELLVRVSRGEARVVVTHDGTPLAAIVSVEDLRRLKQLDREWEETTRALEQFSAVFADIPVEELEAEIDRIIAEGRLQDAEERRSA